MKKFAFITYCVFTVLLLSDSANAQQPTAQFAASTTAGCSPMSVQFTNTSLNASSYLWDFGNGATSTVANPVVAYTTPGQYTVSLVATSGSGLTDTYMLPTTIQVASNPVAAFSVPVAQVCAGELVQLTNLSQNCSSHLWDFGDGNTSTLGTPQHTYAAAGWYTITLVVANAQGCTDTHTMPAAIEVLPAPNPLLQVNDSTACDSNQSFVFDAPCAGCIAWDWDLGDGTVINNATVSALQHVYGQSGSFDVSVTVSDASQCTTTVQHPSMVVISNGQPAGFSVNQPVGCSPHSIQLMPVTSGATQVLFVDYGDGTTGTSLSHTYQQAGYYDITLVVGNGAACTDTIMYDSLVQVLPKPPVNFGATPHIGCAPLQVSFTDSSQQAASWLWSFGDGSTSTLQHPTHTYTTDGSYQVVLEIAGQNGCTNQYQVANMITVASPVATATISDTIGCAPLTVQLAGQGTGLVNWAWQLSSGAVFNQQNATATLQQPGFYNVTLIASTQTGCSDTLVLNNAIEVLDTIIPFNTPLPQTVCEPVALNFDATLFGHTEFLWDFGDGTTDTLAQTSHYFAQPGTYQVALQTRNANNCLSTIPVFAQLNVGGIQASFTDSVLGCPAQAASFTNTTAGAVSFLWSFGDGTADTAANPVHTYGAPGLYTVGLTATDSYGCSSSISTLNAVYIPDCSTLPQNSPPPGGLPVPASASGPGVAGGSSIVPVTPINGCAPYQMSFSNPYDSAVSVVWDFGDGAAFSGFNAVHTYTTAGTYSAMAIGTFANGTTDTLIFPNLMSLGAASAAFTFNSQLFCQSNQVQFNSPAVGGNTIQWNFGDGSTATAANPMHLYPNPGNYLASLVVSDFTGCSDLKVDNVTAGIPNPYFFYSKQLCLSDTLNIDHNLSNFSNLLWDFGDNTTSTAVFPSHQYTAVGSYAVSVSLTDVNGCSYVLQLPDSVTVLQPQADFAFNGPTTGCNQLTVGVSNQSQNANSWFWNFGNNQTATTPNPSITYYAAGSYSVSLTAILGQCSSTVTMVDTVHLSSVSAQFSAIANSDCLPATVAFADSSAGAVQWAWDFGDGTTSTQQNPLHTYTEVPTSPITLTVTNPEGCSDAATGSALAFLTADFNVLSPSGCLPHSTQFAANAAGAISYQWDFGDGSTGTGANPVHVYTDTGHFDVALIVTAASGCSDTMLLHSAVVVSNIVAEVGLLGTNTGCIPLISEFQNLSQGAVGSYWSFGDNTGSALMSPTHIYTNPGEYDVTLAVEDSLGCTDTLNLASFINAIGPVVNFEASDTVGCAPFTVQLTDQSTAVQSWQYAFGDGLADASQNPGHTYAQPGSYMITLIATDSIGCEGNKTIGPLEVLPAPQLSLSANIQSGCLPVEVTLTSQASALDQPTYYWHTQNGTAVGSADTTMLFTSAGLYSPMLEVVNQTGCADTAQLPVPLQIMDTVAIEQPRVWSVSVQDGHGVNLEWETVQNYAFSSYRVYAKGPTDATYHLVTTISDPLQNSYLYACHPELGVYSFKVAVVSHCGLPPAISALPAYNSILALAESDSTGTVVEWTPYINTPFSQYKILRAGADGNFTCIAQVDSGVHNIVDEAVLCPGAYTYCIIAAQLWNQPYEAMSTVGNGWAYGLQYLNQQATVLRSTVVDDDAVLTEWLPPISGEEWVEGYHILRGTDANSLNRIGYVPAGIRAYIDETPDVDADAFVYAIEVENSCHTVSAPVSFGNNMVLQGSSNGVQHLLTWSPYTTWPAEPAAYRVEVLRDGTWETVREVDGATTQLTLVPDERP